ncbi:MAG: hypothetical protein COA43_13365 [Robiginitomaculum sp.]|nr:MAG: hypothetical protein COA43_13365 [Robiginitomaculum sp.]
MKQLTMILSASILALGTFTASGCAVATAGVTKGDERNLARSILDVSAARSIRARMHRSEGFKMKGVDVEVAQGIVLLSGNVPRPEDRVEAERIAWSADKIMQVGNEIRLMDKQGHVRNIKDGVLHQSVRTRLIASKTVKARNYNIEVHDGIVYLMGVARNEAELARAAQIASTTRGTQEVISYVRISDDYSGQTANGPGYNGQPSQSAANNYSAPLQYKPLQLTEPLAPQSVPRTVPQPQTTILDDDAIIDSGEPYYLDPKTGQRVEIPEGVTPIPYMPDAGPGSLGSGGAALPLGVELSAPLPRQNVSLLNAPTSLPSDEHLGEFRTGKAGEAVSIIESPAYMLDPVTGDMIPVRFENGKFVRLIK